MIRIASYLDREGGWARHARALGAALNRLEPTEVFDWSQIRKSPDLVRLWRELTGAGSVGISMGSIDQTFRLDTRYRVAFCIWETTRIPGHVLLLLRRADMIWTMSHWGRDILEEHGLPAAKIRIVPAGVDTAKFRPLHPRPPKDTFRFLSVGKWEERKGSAGLVQAFAREFDPSEPVELVMHCTSAQTSARSWNALLPHGARITISPSLGSDAFVALMQSSDAFVLPTRGEGWGLPILEAMACELPCIVTGYSGLTEYATADNCFLVRVQAMIKAEDPEFYSPEYDWGLWAEPDWRHLRQLMRFVYENRDAAGIKARRAREDAERMWTWDHAAQKAMVQIRELRTRERS